MTMVARKMTVKARCRKSLAFSHSSSATLLTLGQPVVGQLHDEGHGLSPEGGLVHDQRRRNADEDAQHIQADHHQGTRDAGKKAAVKKA